MGQTTGQLKTELEHRRSDVSADLEALGDRVSPGRMADRRRAQMRQSMTRVKDRVMGPAAESAQTVREQASEIAGTVSDAPDVARRQVSGNPVAAGVIAFAAGVLVASMLPESEPEQRLAERVEPKLAEAVGETREAAMEAAQHLKPAAEDAARDVAARARDSADELKERATS
jgi:hypothetical protein